MDGDNMYKVNDNYLLKGSVVLHFILQRFLFAGYQHPQTIFLGFTAFVVKNVVQGREMNDYVVEPIKNVNKMIQLQQTVLTVQ